MNDLARELETALRAVRSASVATRAVQASLQGSALEKSDRSPVTVADYAAQALICRALGAAFAADPIIAEEDMDTLRAPEAEALRAQLLTLLQPFGLATIDAVLEAVGRGAANTAGERAWTLDPIDGTKGFLRGDHYAIALALLIDGRPEIGVLGCPGLDCDGRRGTLLWARRGQGAFHAPLDLDGDGDPRAQARPVQVSAQLEPAALRLCESFESGHSAHGQSAQMQAQWGMTAAPVRMDSQAKYGVLARGEAEVYARLPTRADYREKIWDHAAGVLLVEEAGGRVSDLDGRPLDFSAGRTLRHNRGVLASHGPHHEQLLAALGRVIS